MVDKRYILNRNYDIEVQSYYNNDNKYYEVIFLAFSITYKWNTTNFEPYSAGYLGLGICQNKRFLARIWFQITLINGRHSGYVKLEET